MSIYAIGDIQGCYDQLQRLLELINFEPSKDRLWFAGDLVNRGPNSLEVLRFIKGLGKRAVTVLGNHDLHLLAISYGMTKYNHKSNGLDQILKATDRDELLHWLQNRPLMYQHKKRDFNLIHAGLAPQWDIPTALKLAGEVEQAIRGKDAKHFFQHMYGNQPERWNPFLQRMERLRFITNCFTRLRYCDARGGLALKESAAPGSQNSAYTPWFEMPNRASQHDQIIFGHWSTLGYHNSNNVWAIDSGCLWGGQLTALRVRKRKQPKPIQLECPRASKSG